MMNLPVLLHQSFISIHLKESIFLNKTYFLMLRPAFLGWFGEGKGVD